MNDHRPPIEEINPAIGRVSANYREERNRRQPLRAVEDFDGWRSEEPPPREAGDPGPSEGIYAFNNYVWTHGGAKLPVIIEAWTVGRPVKDRRTSGEVEIGVIFGNRTPALQSHSYGTVTPKSKGASIGLNIGNRYLTVDDVLSGPCNFEINVAITCPELPIISEGKAVDFTPFTTAISEVIAKTLKRAYQPPLYTLEETRPPIFKIIKPPKPIKKKKIVIPHDKGVLGTMLDELEQASGRKRDDLIVMSKDKDPFSIGDSPTNHEMGRWLADILADPAFDDRRHNRGIHYKLSKSGTFMRHDGKHFINDKECWRYIVKAVNAARWLGYISFDRISDHRNAPPVIRQASDVLFDLKPDVHASTPSIQMAAGDSAEIHLANIENFPSYRQPFHIVLFGEKSSLEPVLGELAARYHASLYLPTGEISNDFIYQMAKHGAEDGRRMIVLCFSDFDPVGQGMPVNIARKLQAFKAMRYHDLAFEVHAAALTVEQAVRYNLPSSPLKAGGRADAWKKRHGREQTELDALEAAELREIALAAISPFYDHTLDERLAIARKAWTDAAEEKLRDAIDPMIFDPISDEIAKLAEAVEDGVASLNAQCDVYREAAETIEIMFDRFDPPKPIKVEETPPPLVSTDMNALVFIDILKEHRVVSESSTNDED
ncbi:hypothetical protein SAMN05428967_3365 [Phyllobacterium sp. YR620]|uniref:hypothetical protein n=1 Tax=Phyllobacterium sp. YR620 TaxID=1881066 RepID=UPI00088C2689|nr:hypothetical protein [Phyllobacterium sp. YR620]SDP77296.1 hypothetical protein SAMN05428967_3365 [Phyllobacterium sp. YR620]